MIKEKIEKALNDQIMKEEYSSRIYMAMASWCERKGFEGAANYLYNHSDEERMHMMKLVHFLNDRGGTTKLMKMDTTNVDYKSLKKKKKKILDHEVYISNSINEIYGLCMDEKDYTTGNFMQWYINEQIEEESTMNAVLDKISLAGDQKGGLFHIDKELGSLSAERPAEETAE